MSKDLDLEGDSPHSSLNGDNMNEFKKTHSASADNIYKNNKDTIELDSTAFFKRQLKDIVTKPLARTINIISSSSPFL